MSDMSIDTSLPNPLRDKSTFWAFMICLFGFGGFLAWSALAPLAEGIVASGIVVVEDNRKIVQHLEGGIIRKLNVDEGSIVHAGEVLIELDQTAALTARDQAAQELATQLAILARDEALLDGRDAPDFSAIDNLALSKATREEIISRQRALFEQQRNNGLAEHQVLEAKKASQIARERDRNTQIAATKRALTATSEEMSLRLNMLAQQNETIYTIQNLQRQQANQEAELASLIADRNQARTAAYEIDQQLRQLDTKMSETVSGEMAEARRRALSAREQLTAAQDILRRTVIIAPRDGKVLNLNFTTVGGVIRPSEAIMEIVPNENTVIAEVRVRPNDRDVIAKGQSVKAQLSAYKRWRAKQIDGEVLDISADLKTIPETGQTFYSVRIRLDGDEIAKQDNVEVIPGMPVEVFIKSGNRRTFLDYLLEPLTRIVRQGTQGT